MVYEFNRAGKAAKQLVSALDPFFIKEITANTDMDQWVAAYFKRKSSLVDIIASLRQCSIQTRLCDQVFERLAERSLMAIPVTDPCIPTLQIDPAEGILFPIFRQIPGSVSQQPLLPLYGLPA
jgi:hypothetical protein